MSPFFKALPTALEARSNAVRSGRRAWSMGVGTVTMKKSALLSSPGSDVKTSLERARSCGSTSQVRSRSALSSAIRSESISKPMTRIPSRPNARATGSPTYPRPMTASLRPCGTTLASMPSFANGGFLTLRLAAFAMEQLSGLLEQAPIERDHVTADTLTRKRALDQFTAGLPEFPPQLRIQCEPLDRVGERVGILERHQQRVDVRAGNLPASGHVGRDQGAAAGGGLEQAQRQSLAVRRQHRDMRARPQRSDIGNEAEMLDVGSPRPRFDLPRWDRGRVGGIG